MKSNNIYIYRYNNSRHWPYKTAAIRYIIYVPPSCDLNAPRGGTIYMYILQVQVHASMNPSTTSSVASLGNIGRWAVAPLQIRSFTSIQMVHTHNFLTYSLHTHNLSPHNLLTHNLTTHNLSPHNLLTHNLTTHNLTRRHWLSLCVACVALGDIDRHFAWQVALGDIDLHFAHWAGSGGALGSQLAPWAPRLFPWQASHLATSTVTLRGRRGTYGTGLALVALVTSWRRGGTSAWYGIRRKRVFLRSHLDTDVPVATPPPGDERWGPLISLNMQISPLAPLLRTRGLTDGGVLKLSWTGYQPYALMWDYTFFAGRRSFASLCKLLEGNKFPNLPWASSPLHISLLSGRNSCWISNPIRRKQRDEMS